MINQIKNEYLGHMVDGCGYVMDGSHSGTIIGNKQLHFLAYSIYQYEAWLSL